MFHLHKWTRWIKTSRDMVYIDRRWGNRETPYLENYQFRVCDKCGRYQEEVI
jgi:hypothetical protein